MTRLCWFIFVIIIKLGQPSFWGEIPVERESVQLRLDEKSVSRLDVHLHSQTLGRITLHLSTISDLVANYAKTHTVDRHTHEQTPITNGCHYRGYVNEKEPSSAIFSDCSGRLRGTFTIDGDTWYILYHAGSYILFPESVLPNPPGIVTAEYGGKEIRPGDSRSVFKRDIGSRNRSKREPITVPTKTLEVVVVTDKSMWDHFTQENLNLEEFVISTIVYVDEIFRKYGIRLALVGYERWSTADLITVSSNYRDTYHNFVVYRQKKLLNVYKQHDVSVFMTNVDFYGFVIGYAGIGTMCQSDASNVNFNSRGDTNYLGQVIVHEIGHNFGMRHDDNGACECPADDCVCPSDTQCLMSYLISNSSTTFSNCSRLVLDHFTGTCLHNQPKSLYGDPVCGNGFVEEGEECDCGTEEECLASDPCCEPVGCKLKLGAECYSGDCCEKCRFVSSKEVCRPASSECDLVEFCTGTNSQCPTNRYNQDGSMCGSSTGFCNYGSCQTRDSQCISLWGQSASNAARECYQRYNSKGDWYGNCGSLDNNKYLACTENNIMCGKLYCSVPEGQGVKTFHKNIYYLTFVYNDTVSCSMVSLNRTHEDSQEIAMVYDGTKCGDQKWCLAGQCVEFEKKVTCPSPGGVVCGGHGTCNDLNQCHCDAGYDPGFNCALLIRCTGLPSDWVNIQSHPSFTSLPVDYGTVLTLSCPAGHTLVGSETVTCIEGTDFTLPGDEPKCKPAVAGWDITNIMMVVVIVVVVVLPLCIAALLIARRCNPRVKSFLDHHFKILRVRRARGSTGSQLVVAAPGRSTGSAGSTTAPRCPVPPSPVVNYLVSPPRHWAASSYHDDVIVVSAALTLPQRPEPSSNTSSRPRPRPASYISKNASSSL